MQGGKGGAMGFGRSKAKLLNEAQGKVTFNDVAGVEEAKEEVEEIVEFLKDPKKFSRLGGKIPKGALLIGPPGTGKLYWQKLLQVKLMFHFFLFLDQTLLKCLLVLEHQELEICLSKVKNILLVLFLLMK